MRNHLQKAVKLILIITFMVSLLLQGNLFAQSVSLPTDRGRLKIVKIKDIRGGDSLLVVRTDANTQIRGISPGIEKKQTQLSSIREGFIKDQSNAGMNAIRLIWFEAWQKGAGYAAFTDFNNPTEVAHCLAMIEIYVNLCSKCGMYCIINFHSGFGFVYDEAYATQMWTIVAAHFKNRTHVAFEIANEPSNDFNAWMGNAEMQKYANIYNLVKSLAPNTLQIVLTPNRLPDSSPTAVDLATKLASLTTIDWSNTVVGYHLYAGTLTSIRNLHKKFPALPTENNFPVNSGALKDQWTGVSLDGDYYTSQTCEKFGLGWLHWAMNNDNSGDQSWYYNWPFMLKDALTKGWYWSKDPFGNLDTTPPTTPTGEKAANITGYGCKLTWNASTDDNGVSFYGIFYGSAYLGVALTNSCTLSNLTPNTSYSITIKARDAAGNWSEASSVLPVATLANIALKKTAEASSVTSTLYSASKAVDGIAATLWRSAATDANPWISIDLGDFYTLNNLKLTWSTPYATSYLIETSADGIIYKTLKSLTGQNGADDELTGLNTTTRFVRLSAKALSAATGVSLISFEVYGTFAWPTITETKKNAELIVYPNPVKDMLYIENATARSEIQIYDLNGNVILNQLLIENELNIRKLSAGIYFIRIEDADHQIQTMKIVKL